MPIDSSNLSRIYLFGLMVEWLQSPACHVGGTGSNPVGTARKYARFIGIFQAYSKIPPMGAHVPRHGDRLLQGLCGEFDSHRLHKLVRKEYLIMVQKICSPSK